MRREKYCIAKSSRQRKVMKHYICVYLNEVGAFNGHCTDKLGMSLSQQIYIIPTP